MSSHPLSAAALALLALALLGCAAPSDDAARGKAVPDPVAHEDLWRGLERHELQLVEQKLLVVKGSRGVVGCPYLDIDTFERLDEACALIPAADIDGMLDSKVTAVTPRARALGIEIGMSGREALDRIR